MIDARLPRALRVTTPLYRVIGELVKGDKHLNMTKKQFVGEVMRSTGDVASPSTVEDIYISLMDDAGLPPLEQLVFNPMQKAMHQTFLATRDATATASRQVDELTTVLLRLPRQVGKTTLINHLFDEFTESGLRPGLISGTAPRLGRVNRQKLYAGMSVTHMADALRGTIPIDFLLADEVRLETIQQAVAALTQTQTIKDFSKFFVFGVAT